MKRGHFDNFGAWYSLPQPSKQFIQQYIEEYNKGNFITEVEVEYEELNEPKTGTGKTNIAINKIFHNGLKINYDNIINIKSIKESWNKKEVIELCRSAHLHGEQGALNLHYQTFKQWVEENL